ncbi:MAG: ABC transporter permease [Bacteroidetes bacterium]|uniref:ABC transporter permease n=1 Tax=Candidatus Merdivivens pullicola TaxID=2840872 RepID=A0A9D9IJF0_9BACT|nr:ABC transporter permease [Candidatus Merdivivens pullicola]
MKQFLAFIRKEFRHVLRDKRTMLILLGMPVAQIILFGFAISTEIRNIDTALLVPEAGENIRRLSERFEASDYFSVVSLVSDEASIDGLFQRGEADLVIAFSPGFEESMYSPEGASIRLIADATNTNAASAMTMYASNIINDFVSEKISETGMPPVSGVQPNIRMLYNPQMRSAYTFVPGVMGLIIILICAMMTSVSIVREKETGTMELLLVSPVKPIVVIMAKIVPYFVVSMVNYLTILALSVWLLHLPISGSFWALTLLSVIYIVLSLALGQLISTIAKTQVSAMLMSGFMLLVPVLFFSELLFPVDSMPLVFRWFSDLIPARWYVIGVKKIMIEGLPMAYAAREFIILSVMAAVIMAVSLMRYKNRM